LDLEWAVYSLVEFSASYLPEYGMSSDGS
jgi:hypothetical protein